ncbi:MAG: glycosyltransferase, partial [Actinobacteria bacterium]|nr:glycosyltransferase [Actinomycetota bacterium]
MLPTYERARYLRAALDSALAQTMPDFVVLIGDNSRSTETEAVVRTYDDPRIRYVRHPENLGQQGNWLWLIEHAETPFVASLHDDDVWHPTFLADLLPHIENDPSVSMVFSDFDVVDEDGAVLRAATDELRRRSHRETLPAGRLHLDLAAALRLVAVWNAPQPAYCAVLRRSAVLATQFPAAIDPVYDIWLSYQIARRGEAFAYAPGVHTQYRWHSGSSTNTGWAAQEDEIFSRIIVDNSGLGEVIDEIERYWAHIRWGRGVRLMSDPGRQTESRTYLRSAANRLDPARRLVAAAAGHSTATWSALGT